MKIQDTLFLIPARGGSKGLPRKNILPLAGKPMILYTIDAAREVADDENICVSTDDTEIITIIERHGLSVPFVRPVGLAKDTSSSREVILHALDFFEKERQIKYKKICLLQPTSPLRMAQHIRGALELWNDYLDMVVSVKEAKSNPYLNLFEEGINSYLRPSKIGNFTRRQDAPKVWEYNGAIYLINSESIREQEISAMEKVKKYLMDPEHSIDIDNEIDFRIALYLLEILDIP